LVTQEKRAVPATEPKTRIGRRGAEFAEGFYFKLFLYVLSASAVKYPKSRTREKFQAQ
jgi:hypothetical protein